MDQNASKEYATTYFMFKFMVNKRSVGIIFVPDLFLTCCASYKINRMFLSLSPILLANPLKILYFNWPCKSQYRNFDISSIYAQGL